MSLINIQNVFKSYFLAGVQEPVLKGINLNIHQGDFVALMGPSGSGKSTLMNIIGLLDKPTGGEYFLQGREVSQLTKNDSAQLRNELLGFVFQQFFLLPRLNALQNVCLPLRYRDIAADEANELARAKLKSVGMEKLWFHKPSELSGGQQQRVAIARALVTEPTLILADEPTGALDTKTGQEVLDILKSLNEQHQTTVLVVTHDEAVAAQCKTTVRMLDGVIHEDQP